MKLNEIAVFLQERLFAITGSGGKNDHVHRVDFSAREGTTSVDEKHNHNYRLGDKKTTGTIRVPDDADVQDHDHDLPMLLREAQDFERVFSFLINLEKEDFQQLANPLNDPKPNAPLSFRVQSHPLEGIKLKMTFFNTGNKYAMESLGRYITPLLKEIGINPNRVHYHVLAYHPPMPQLNPEEEARLPEVDFEYVEDKASLTMAVAIVGQHAIKESVEDQLDEAVRPRMVALNLVDVFKILKGNTQKTKTAVLDSFEILDEKNRRIVSTWVTDLLGASRRATGTAASNEEVREGQEASSAGVVAFDLIDVVSELGRNKSATSKAVKDSFRGLSSQERSTISNWVAALVDLVTPKG